MPRSLLRSFAFMVALVGCSGRGCGHRDDTSETCDDADKQPWYADEDGDGHGDALRVTWACVAPADYVADGDDCDDTSEGWQAVSRHADADGDGFGAGSAVQVCETAPGYADDDQDCDDTNGAVYPDAPVTCGDDIDQDCDNLSDCEAPTGTLSANQADARIGGSAGGNMGAALLAADIDGDGVADLATGAPVEDGTGAAYVLYGPVEGAYAEGDMEVKISGNGEDMAAGATLALGDLDADGDADLVVGAPEGDYAQGGVSVYIVSAPLPTELTLDGGDGQDVLQGGTGASIVADQDYAGGDEIADLLAGNAGSKVRLKEGPITRSTDLTENNDGYIYRPASASLGNALAMLGDVTGDGIADLGVGAYQGMTGYEGEPTADAYGNIYIVDDPAVFQEEDKDLPFWRACVYGPAEDGGMFGWSIAPAGDQDGDGYADVAVGGPGVGGGAGAVYLYSGDALSGAGNEEPVLAEESLAKISPTEDAMQLGYSLSGGTDANGDGMPDLLIGAPGDADGRGSVTLWYGPLLNDVDTDEADYTLTGETDGDTFGAAVNMLADFNGLGRPDLVVGATGVNEGDGAVYLFFTDGL